MGKKTGLYKDPDTGKLISTNSMLKTFRRCPKQAEYKYHRRLKPRVLSQPLTRGKWMHSLLEAYYRKEDWEAVHNKLTKGFAKLFDEEKEALGDLPRECHAMMKSYIWHYKNHEWDVKEVEGLIEAEFPDGSIFRGKYDLMIEDEFGLAIVDHKNHKRFPDFSFRLMDSQSGLYLWAARQNGLPINRFIWNYVKAKPMTKPTTIQSGKRLSLTTMRNCDYPTAVNAIKEANLNHKDYLPWLRGLKAQQFSYDRPQTSEFFQRHTLEKDDAFLDRVALEYYHTSLRMHDYNFKQTDTVERIPDRSCTFMCSYAHLCQTELFGGNADLILRKQFSVGDPMDYYYDEKETEKED